MVSDYEVAVAKRILKEKEKQTADFLKLHTKLVNFLLKRPDLVREVRITSHDDGDMSLGFSVFREKLTDGFSTIDFYTFDSPERAKRKFNAARDFVAGAITSFPNDFGL